MSQFHLLSETNCFPYRRQVSKAEGEKLAEANKAAFTETSAKENINVGA